MLRLHPVLADKQISPISAMRRASPISMNPLLAISTIYMIRRTKQYPTNLPKVSSHYSRGKETKMLNHEKGAEERRKEREAKYDEDMARALEVTNT